MPQLMPTIFLYVGLLSLITFLLFGADKLKALPAMVLFHHKTNGKKHPSFCWGVPAAAVIHLALIYLAGVFLG